MDINKIQHPLLNPLFWITFVLYIIVLSIGISQHELWFDELHSWNIAKGSTSFFDLISNTRYEGHPPIWYSILWIISKFTHNIHYMQLAQLVIASAVVFVVLFLSSFPLITRILIPFGYYFLFDYGILSRNYAIGVLFASCICLIMRKEFKYKIFLYYVLLFLMSNTHLIALLLAGCLHLYFLIMNIEQKKKKSTIVLHIVLGVIIFLPAIYFILPPSDSVFNMSFWGRKWNIHKVFASFTAPLKAFMPIPAWWKYNFWNTQFLIEAQNKYTFLKVITGLLTAGIFSIIFFLLKKDKKVLILCIINLILTFVAFNFFPSNSVRYIGFIYIGFLVSYWLYCYEKPISKQQKWFVNVILIAQLLGGFFSFIKDIQFPFSNAYKINEVLQKIPQNKKIISDYASIDILSAFMDRPFYCIEKEKELSFLLWKKDPSDINNTPNRYSSTIANLFQKERIKKVYMVSIYSLKSMTESNSQLFKSFQVNLIDKREGAIEVGGAGNFYLYKISDLKNSIETGPRSR